MALLRPSDFEVLRNSFIPGGMTTIICGNWVARVLALGEDSKGLGRWSYVTLKGKGAKVLTIITAYNACATTGDTTFYSQQQCQMSKFFHHHQIRSIPQPRQQFYFDLKAWITHLQVQGHDIILNMDANDPYNPDNPLPTSYPLPYAPGTPARGHLQPY
jgi:hypothetical protein